MNLRCAEGWQIGFLGSSFFFGLVIGSTFLSRLGDTIGRIKMLRISLLLSLILYACLIYISRHLYTHYAFIFGIGMLSCLRLNLGFLYAQEIVSNRHVNFVGSMNNVLDGFTMIIAALYFSYISKEWLGLQTIFFLTTLVGFVISLWLPESPKFLMAKRKFLKARHSFNQIARVNKN